MRADALDGQRAQAAHVVVCSRFGAEEGAELEAGGEPQDQQARVDGTHFELALLLL